MAGTRIVPTTCPKHWLVWIYLAHLPVHSQLAPSAFQEELSSAQPCLSEQIRLLLCCSPETDGKEGSGRHPRRAVAVSAGAGGEGPVCHQGCASQQEPQGPRGTSRDQQQPAGTNRDQQGSQGPAGPMGTSRDQEGPAGITGQAGTNRDHGNQQGSTETNRDKQKPQGPTETNRDHEDQKG